MAKSSAKAVVRSSQSREEKKWQAQDDLRTLQRAQEVQADSRRMAAVTREAKAQMAALAKVKK